MTGVVTGGDWLAGGTGDATVIASVGGDTSSQYPSPLWRINFTSGGAEVGWFLVAVGTGDLVGGNAVVAGTSIVGASGASGKEPEAGVSNVSPGTLAASGVDEGSSRGADVAVDSSETTALRSRGALAELEADCATGLVEAVAL